MSDNHLYQVIEIKWRRQERIRLQWLKFFRIVMGCLIGVKVCFGDKRS